MTHSPESVSPTSPRRYPEAEGRLPWLASLLNAYAVLDAGIARAVAEDGRVLACRTGCFTCCLQPIPASTLEVLGLKWFALERLARGERRALGRSLRRGGAACPFLVDGACAAYALRPMACREFVLFGRPCLRGERPELTRARDLLALPVTAQLEAFTLLLPHYGEGQAGEGGTKSQARLVLRDTEALQSTDWSGLAGALACKITIDRSALGD